MSMTSTPATSTPIRPNQVRLGDAVSSGWYAVLFDIVELTKPKISLMALVAVAVAGTMARWGQPDVGLLLHAVVGIALVAASASSSNQLWERRLDAVMPRTSQRPLASGRLSSQFARLFAVVTGVTGVLYLLAFTGLVTSLLGIATWILYVLVYTPLKTRTWWNTAIGAVGGAMPVVLGWHATGGAWDSRLLALFSLLFLWQFPHFMAIAWLYREDYARAGMKMLPVVDPSGRRAGVQAMFAAAALIPVSLFPVLFDPGLGSLIYLMVALSLGVGQLLLAVRFFQNRDEHSARRLLRASLIYLPAVLLLLVLHPWL